MDWKAQIGILLIACLACFFLGRSSVSKEYIELTKTEIKWLPKVELKYIGQATLSNVPLNSVNLSLGERTSDVLDKVKGKVRVASFDSLFSDSTHISGKYFFPPVNMFDIKYSIPQRPDTTYYYESQKIIREYPFISHGIVLSLGYSPFSKRFDGFIGYGVTLHIQNLFK